MSSTTGSTPPPPEVKRAAVVTHGHAETIGEALERLRAVADEPASSCCSRTRRPPSTATATAPTRERRPRGRPRRRRDDAARAAPLPRHRRARARRQLRARRLPHRRSRPDDARGRASRRVVRRRATSSSSCRRSRSRPDGERWPRSTTSSCTSSTLGRMVELGWAIGGEDLGSQPCDGLICSTPSGSTAYNLSNGGPVLVWGLDAMAITFVAPHSLHARPLVVPRGRALTVANRTPDVSATVLADGQQVHELAPGDAGRGAALGASAACSRRCRRARSSAATGARSSPSRNRHTIGTIRVTHCVRLGPVPSLTPSHPGARVNKTACAAAVSAGRRSRPADVASRRAAPAPHREPRPDPRGRARARARAERDHGRDRRGQDDPRAGDRPPARRARRRGARRARRRRGLRRGRARAAAGLLRRRGARARSPSCGPRTRRGSCSRAASSPTAARAPTPGAAAPPARTSPPRPSG